MLEIRQAIDADEVVVVGGGQADEVGGDAFAAHAVVMQGDMREAVGQELRLRGEEHAFPARHAVIGAAGPPMPQQQVGVDVVIRCGWRAGGPPLGMGIAVVGLVVGVKLGMLAADWQVDEMNGLLVLFSFQPVDEGQPALGQNEGLLRLVGLISQGQRQAEYQRAAICRWQPTRQGGHAQASQHSQWQQRAAMKDIRRPEGLEYLGQQLGQIVFWQPDMLIARRIHGQDRAQPQDKEDQRQPQPGQCQRACLALP